MTNADKFPYEKPVEVEVKITPEGSPATHLDGKSRLVLRTVKRWVIMDTHPDVARIARYRTDHPLNNVDAWTSSVYVARWFLHEVEATEALKAMWEQRLILAERSARKAQDLHPDNPARA